MQINGMFEINVISDIHRGSLGASSKGESKEGYSRSWQKPSNAAETHGAIGWSQCGKLQ